MIQVREKDGALHVQATKDEALNSSPNRSYGWAFDLYPTDSDLEVFRDIAEEMDTLPSLAGTEALYVAAEIENGFLYVDGTSICAVPPEYQKASEAKQEQEDKPEQETDEVEVSEETTSPRLWLVAVGDKVVFVKSEEKPEVKEVKEVINVDMP